MRVLLAAALSTQAAWMAPAPPEPAPHPALAHLALESAAGTASFRPDPLLAAALTGSAPLAVFAILNPTTASAGNILLLGLTGIGAGALMLSSGYVYGGDPGRGLVVSLSAVGIGTLGFVGVPVVACTLGGCGGGAWGGVGEFFLGMAVTAASLTAYYVWAVFDAYATAEKAGKPQAATAE